MYLLASFSFEFLLSWGWSNRDMESIFVLTFTVFPALSQLTVIVALVSPSFKVFFSPFCSELPWGWCLDSQSEEERNGQDWSRMNSCWSARCQGLAECSWGSSRHLVHTGPAQLVQLLIGRVWLPSSPQWLALWSCCSLLKWRETQWKLYTSWEQVQVTFH